MFDFTKFMRGELVVLCRTEEIAKNFLATLVKTNLISSVEKDGSLRRWDIYETETCFRFTEKGIYYSPDSYYVQEGFKVYEWQAGDDVGVNPLCLTNSVRNGQFKRVIEHYGEELQTIVAIEEMTELTKTLTKQLRGLGNCDHIAEEMADVYICLSQLKIMYEIPDEVIENWIYRKIERTEKRLKEAE